ncbi:cytidine deaminase [Tenuifilum thalassicum]|uniref:Cytidine deaminase n=1 Tax=Tenuifilum thalassicum TaxID=2590900 RepID=A0A7D4CS51_9BACT|nr:cytidine deaminase [Tenuifilum thalassicum]QKG80585.1 cytidine deaminase [Tenuifilum thalassicum]
MLTIDYKELTVSDGMENWERELIEKAKDALSGSYSPYSHFRVGAAVLLENGEVITGSNQENGAYPSGLCAERVALFYAGSKYPNVPIKAMAVVASSGDGITKNPISPCGACRQVMLEYQNISKKAYPVYMVGENKIIRVSDVKDLLPFSFTNVDDVDNTK